MSDTGVTTGGAAGQLGAGAGTGNGTATPPTFGADLTGDDKTWFDAKGFKTMPDVARSYRELEKLIGVKDTLLQVPVSDKPEEWAGVYDRLGRPKDPTGYKIDLPEGADRTFADTAAKWFHEAGLSERQAAPLVKQWNAHVEAQTKAAEAAQAEQLAREGEALKASWGAKFDENLTSARKAANALGMTAEQVESLEKSSGFAQTMQFFARLHGDYGIGKEGGLIGVKSGGSTAGSVQEAQAEITKLMTDGDFQKKIADGDKLALERWSTLHRRAYPAQAA